LVAGNGESFLFKIIDGNDFIKVKCINKDKEIWNCKNNMPSFGPMDLRLLNNCNELDKSFSELGNSYALPNGIE
jgi:hypothetical protein